MNSADGGAAGGEHSRAAATPNRRQVLWSGAAAAAGIVLGTASTAAAASLATATQDEHARVKIAWGYPLASRAVRRSGVDGYPGASYAGHNGVDYFTEPRIGTTIYAVADGVITDVSDPLKSSGDLGQFVRIRHDAGIFSAYGHMTPGSTRVGTGQRITRGMPIGATGWSGRVSPKTPETAHLHLSIYSPRSGLPTLFWNPVWFVENAPLPPSTPAVEDPDMPFLVQSDRGHIYTVAPRYIRHETSMTDVTFLQTVYSRYVVCRSDAQFRAVLASLSVPLAQAEAVRGGAGGGTWAQ